MTNPKENLKNWLDEIRKEWINYCLDKEVNISQCADWWIGKFESELARQRKETIRECIENIQKIREWPKPQSGAGDGIGMRQNY